MSFNPMAWLRAFVADGKVLKRSGNGFTGASVAATDAANTFAAAQTIAPAAATSGARTLLTVTAPADTGITTTVEQTDVLLGLHATRTWATGAVTTQRFVRVRQPTIAAAGASTFTTAVTFEIDGAPIAGTNATLTNSYAFRVAAGASYFAGATTVAAALAVAPVAAASGTRTALTLTTPADTGITTTVEQTDVDLNLSSTRTWATGGVAAQRFVRVRAPTIAAAGASTFTYAALVYIEGAPIAGTNATLTTSYALFVDGDRVRFDGPVVQNDYPVIQSTSVLTGSPAVNTPCGVVQVDSGQTAVTVTATAVTANSLIFAQIRNATSNAVSVLRVVPGSGSFVITLSGDPGASHAQVAFQVLQPGAGT